MAIVKTGPAKKKKKTEEELIQEMRDKGQARLEQQELLKQQKAKPRFLDLPEDKPIPPTKIITDERGKQVGVEQESGRTILGISPRDVAAITKQPMGTATGTTGGVPGMGGQVVGAQEYAQMEREQQRVQALEEEKFKLEGERPERVDLNPPEMGATTVPLIGGMARQVALAGFESAAAAWQGRDTSLIRENLGLLTEADIKNMAISEIQKEELRKGLTTSEHLGALLEGIPGAAWASKYIDFESPRGNLEEVMKDLKAMKRPITNWGSDVKAGDMTQATAKMKIADMEQYINFQEARLKLLIIHSPSLEFNSDRVNHFETDIWILRDALHQAKIDVINAEIMSPEERSMFSIYNKQQQQASEEWASSDW